MEMDVNDKLYYYYQVMGEINPVRIPSKHEVLAQCCFNVGPALISLSIYKYNTFSYYCIVYKYNSTCID